MRILLRVLAPLIGLGVAVVGTLLAIEVIAAWTRLDPDQAGVLVPWPQWREVLETTPWTDPLVAGIAVGVAVLGLLLLLVGLFARRSDIAVTAPRPDVTVTTSPRVLARLIGKRVRGAEGVAGASVTASRRRVRVVAQGWGDLDGGRGKALRSAVDTAVSGLLDDLPLRRRPRVAVRATQRKGPR